MPNVKLGKGPVKDDPRTFKASRYMEAVSPPPPSVDWITQVPQWNMFGNDRYGDCTFATVGHLTQKWTTYAAGSEVTLSDQDILAGYSAVTGFDPNTGVNDNGAVELDVLNYWRKTGVGGHQIAAYVKLDPHNHDQIKQAINLFGGVYIGLDLPASASDQIDKGEVWDVVSGDRGAPGSWGGHAVHAGAYDEVGLTVITWGQPQNMTWAFWDKYCDEAYAVLSQDWINNNVNPQGFDLATLQQDLSNVGNNQPNVDPTPQPAPTPGPTPTPSDQLTVNLSNTELVQRITRTSSKQGLTPEQYVTERLLRYYHLSDALGGLDLTE